ncbi:phage holin family protein [Algirhabdus cladophorae]|uniref:phage holin family protein n=1 Tax=Algirhabdus cladophorae TaxID=3377108 RepID=UPI003B8472B3
MMPKHTLHDAPSLFADTLRHFTSLVQGEMTLAKAEMSRAITRASAGIALLAVAFLMALVALNVLASAAVAYIAANGLFSGAAALIVGGALLGTAIGIGLLGKARLSTKTLVATKTATNIHQDITTIKEASNV